MYICGTLRWQARTGDKTINNEYEDYMRIKCGRGLDYTNRFSLRQMCMLDIKGILLKGDIGTNTVREGRDIYFQGIEGDRIGNPYDYNIESNFVRGLHIDDSGAIISADIYYRDRKSSMFYFDQTIPLKDKQGMPRFMFLVSPISYDDYRGVSVFKTAIDNATYIERMRNYELQALLWASSQSGVFHTKSGALPEALPFDKLTPIIDASGNKIDTYEVRPNTVTALGVGEDVSMFQHDRPSPNVVNMFRDTIRDVCIGVGCSFEFGWDSSGLTGPAVRSVSSQDARAFETWQQLLLENKLDPVAGLILGNAIANGELPFHPLWNKWQWFFPAKSTIDAGRESQANIEEIHAGINTGARVAADDGMDIEEIQDQLGREMQNKIEIAMQIADNVSKEGNQPQPVDWREVFNYMFPQKKGMGGGGVVGGTPSPDGAGATSDGAEMDGQQDGGNGSRNGEGASSRFRTVMVAPDGTVTTKLYSADQARDEQGRFEDEGGGGPTSVAVGKDLAINTENADFEGKGWKQHYMIDKSDGKYSPVARMFTSPEKDNKIAIRLVETMPDQRGKGYGSRLIQHAISHAKAKGASAVVSDPEGGVKQGAARLLEKHGFQKQEADVHGGFQWTYSLTKLRWDEDLEKWYREDQARDEGGRFEDEGRGSDSPGYVHPGAGGKGGTGEKTTKAAFVPHELTGLDKAIADYKPDRTLSDPTKTEPIAGVVPGVSYTPYSKTPFFNQVNILQGNKDPLAHGVKDYVDNRDLLFDTIPPSKITLNAKDTVVTQEMVNKDRVNQLIANPSTGGTDPIQVVKHNDKYYILNGHHRMVAGMKGGSVNIEAHVLDLDHPAPALPKNDSEVGAYVDKLKQMPTYKSVIDRLSAMGATNGDLEKYSLDQHTGADGKLTPERQAEHDAIANHFLNSKAVAPEGVKPKAIFLIGKPAAGKSTSYDERAKEFGEVTPVGADLVRERLSDYRGYNAAATQTEAKMITGAITKKALAAKQSMVFDEVGGNTKKLMDRAKELHDGGYEIHVLHVDSPMHQTVPRSLERFERTGRFVEPEYQLKEADDNPINTYKALRDAPFVTSWEHVDNKDFKHIITEQGRRGVK
jgi:capsid protein/GNAT superfamily N-acetyltransferase